MGRWDITAKMRHKKIAGTTHPQCSLTYWITVKKSPVSAKVAQKQPILAHTRTFFLRISKKSCTFAAKLEQRRLI